MLDSTIHGIETDVAIIGGGTAGLSAAMGAAESGLEVLMVDKAHIQRSGATAGGIDHFMAYIKNGEDWDSRKAYLGYVARVARGAANTKITEKVYCDELPAAIARIKILGVFLRDPREGSNNDFYRTQSMGQPGPYWINFNGKDLKPRMAREIKRRRCRILNRVQVTKLYTHAGVLADFVGFNVRTGDIYRVRAKAVIISTGSTNRMFKTQNGNPARFP